MLELNFEKADGLGISHNLDKFELVCGFSGDLIKSSD